MTPCMCLSHHARVSHTVQVLTTCSSHRVCINGVCPSHTVHVSVMPCMCYPRVSITACVCVTACAYLLQHVCVLHHTCDAMCSCVTPGMHAHVTACVYYTMATPKPSVGGGIVTFFVQTSSFLSVALSSPVQLTRVSLVFLLSPATLFLFLNSCICSPT